MIDLETDIKTAISTRQGQLVIKRTQDVTPYLEQNQREYNEHSDYRPMRGNLRKIAEVPCIVAEQWLKEGVNIFSNDPAQIRAVRRKLDDYTNRKLRTTPGRLGVRQRHR